MLRRNFLRQEEYRRIEGIVRARGIKPIRQGVRCPLYHNGSCSIYESRPLVCRLYGHVEGMNCPRGYNVNISKPDEQHWQREMSKGHGIRSIHELVYSKPEVQQIVNDEIARQRAQPPKQPKRRLQAAAARGRPSTMGTIARREASIVPKVGTIHAKVFPSWKTSTPTPRFTLFHITKDLRAQDWPLFA